MYDELQDKLLEVSGADKRTGKKRTPKVYQSITLPGFDKYEAHRDTLERFEFMQIDQDLSDKVVIDYASCIGGMVFESHMRNAKEAIGYEFNKPRVEVCNEIVDTLKLDNVAFKSINFDEEMPTEKADLIFCLSMDMYLHDDRVDDFYRLLSQNLNEGGTALIESLYWSEKPKVGVFKKIREGKQKYGPPEALLKKHFKSVEFLKAYSSYFSPTRYLFRCKV